MKRLILSVCLLGLLVFSMPVQAVYIENQEKHEDFVIQAVQVITLIVVGLVPCSLLMKCVGVCKK